MAIIHDASGNPLSTLHPADTFVSSIGAGNATVTLTLPAAGVGLYHYVTHIRFGRTNTSATAIAQSAPGAFNVTTTNLAGTLTFHVTNATPGNSFSVDVDEDLMPPFKSAVANTITTFVLPAAGASVAWFAYVAYFVAP